MKRKVLMVNSVKGEQMVVQDKSVRPEQMANDPSETKVQVATRVNKCDCKMQASGGHKW